MRVILIRHAETVWNAAGKVQGQADPELSEIGWRQCRQVAERLASTAIDVIYSSDLARARETAAAVAERQRGLEVRLEPGLREISLGEWEGADRETLRRRWPDRYATWRRQPSWDLVPGGEGGEAFRVRVMSCLGRIVAATNSYATLALVTHIGVIRVLLSTIVGAEPDNPRWPWAVDNTGLTVLRGPATIAVWTTPALEVLAINDSLHLDSPPAGATRP